MPIFVEFRRGEPEQGFMCIVNNTEVAAAETALAIGEPVFTDIGTGETSDGVSIDDDGNVAGDFANHLGPATAAIAYGATGTVTIWGYHGAVAKTAAAGAWVAGTHLAIVDITPLNSYTLLIWDAALGTDRCIVLGPCIVGVATGATSAPVFCKCLGSGGIA
jgi:hypothetical protein